MAIAGGRKVNRIWMLVLCVSVIVIGVTQPVYGKGKTERQGDLTGINEQIINLKKDYLFLENEIQKLREEWQ